MKSAVLLCALFASFAAAACEQELAGVYGLHNVQGTLIETLQLKTEGKKLVAYTKSDSGQWELNPQQPQPFTAQAFSAFTKLPPPTNYCGILVSGVILARVPAIWRWAGFSTQSGYTAISLGGPREIYRVRP
ncbi:hypothetical protein RZC90_006895 [Pseudomonas aeruginosa]|nr:hypothetical protein [Pseudomonas aeruginosa]EKW5154105.1 hypothetical protein [Pseudomonas aeruginosa]EKW5154761.1 hypothetical protein [Pseudomonas aeruginosa]ELO0608360.1 hypothetical protein [Pseudomonas aeruginosa]ELO0608664.1 hypothetical protein [Pseudomonas aeruginosa]